MCKVNRDCTVAVNSSNGHRSWFQFPRSRSANTLPKNMDCGIKWRRMHNGNVITPLYSVLQLTPGGSAVTTIDFRGQCFSWRKRLQPWCTLSTNIDCWITADNMLDAFARNQLQQCVFRTAKSLVLILFIIGCWYKYFCQEPVVLRNDPPLIILYRPRNSCKLSAYPQFYNSTSLCFTFFS